MSNRTHWLQEEYQIHDRTSCSDDELNNITADGQGCKRCNAIALDHYELLKNQIVDVIRTYNAQGLSADLGDEIRILRQISNPAYAVEQFSDFKDFGGDQ